MKFLHKKAKQELEKNFLKPVKEEDLSIELFPRSSVGRASGCAEERSDEAKIVASFSMKGGDIGKARYAVLC